MIEIYVRGQRLRVYSPLIAADTISYLTGRVYFDGNEWNDYNKWLHFRKGDTVYDIELHDNEIRESDNLSLTAGEWECYLTGVLGTARLTSSVAALTVVESGLIDAPLHALPQSVAEQLDAKATRAERMSADVKARADAGEFNGRDGKGFVIYAYVDSVSDLPATGEEGRMYGVGIEAPFDVYNYDMINHVWVNNGQMQGPPGETGAAGKFAIASLSGESVLSWTWSTGGSEGLPQAQSIKGAPGGQGPAGAAGKSAYQSAQEGGYSGDEESFYNKLGNFDAHAVTHRAGGTDEIVIVAGNIAANAVTAPTIAAGAVSTVYTATIGTSWTGSAAPYTQTVSVSGITADDKPIIDIVPSDNYTAAQQQLDAWAEIYRIVTGANGITVYSHSATSVSIPIQIRAVRK